MLAFRRGSGTVVALNLSDEPASVALSGEVLLTTELDGREGEVVAGSLALRAGEGAMLAEGAGTAAG